MDLQYSKNNEMKQKLTRIIAGITAMALIGFADITKGQATIFEEDFGTPTSNTLIQNYSGWQNTSVVYVGNGTCDIRTSNASTGYGGASGGGNVMINDTTKWFQISGLNTTGTQPTVKLFCGLRKTNSEDGTNFVVEFSTDSIVWVRLPMADTLPTGSGTSGWRRVCFPNVPAHPHLHIRFSNLANVDYRLDDIRIMEGDEIVLETVETPTCTPAGGIYYEPQQVTLMSATSGATVHYTLDGSIPDTLSPVCGGVLNINTSCTIKAFATHENMHNSEVMSAQYTILDTNTMVELPFDISSNSENEKTDVKTIPGFRSNKLGNSYADGSAKFESKNAGSASLIAHLDTVPDQLSFDLKGVKGGSPSAYNGITFLIGESTDGVQWSTVATLNESDISTEGFSHHGPYNLSEETRYVRWLLATATSGNTQLNNIVITKQQTPDGSGTGGDDGETGLNTPSSNTPNPYPNPAQNSFRWNLCEEGIVIQLLDATGNIIRQWETVQNGETLDLNGLSTGNYLLRATTASGRITKKLIIK